MDTHKFRAVRPKLTDWIERKGDTIEDAIADYHYENTSHLNSSGLSVSIFVPLEEGKESKRERQWFTLFEAEDGQQYISRICTMGIDRKGGVKSPRSTRTLLEDVARLLEVKLEDLADPWDGEEDYEGNKING